MFGLSKKEKAIRASRAHSFQVMDAQTDLNFRISHYACLRYYACLRCGEGTIAIYLVKSYQDISPAGEAFNKSYFTFLGNLCARCQEVIEGPHPTRVDRNVGPVYSVDEWVKRPRGK